MTVHTMSFKTCLLSLAAALLACGPAPELPRPDGPAAPLALPEGLLVGYVLQWSWDGARRQDSAYVFENDLGYTIAVDAAHVATSRVELVPCAGRRSSLAGAVAALLVPTAHAAHPRVGDPSAVVAPRVESFTGANARLFGRGFAGPRAYCGLHLLAAPVDAAADDGGALARETLVLRGRWSAPGSAEQHVFRASINLQDGRVRPLAGWTDWPAADLPRATRLAVVITRHPARAFDGLDLARLGETELGFEVLGNLLQGTEVRVTTR